jgi:hypothetical protein
MLVTVSNSGLLYFFTLTKIFIEKGV